MQDAMRAFERLTPRSLDKAISKTLACKLTLKFFKRLISGKVSFFA